MTKVIRSTILMLSLAALAACEGSPRSPTAPDPTMTAPSALAAAAKTSTQTICTNPQTTELSYDLNAWIPAFYAGDLGPPYGTTIPGSQWVGPYPLSGIVDAAQPGTYYFRDTFTLPVGSKNISLSGGVHADNQATFFLNGVQFFQQQPEVSYDSFQDPPDPFSTHKEFVDGLNVFRTTLVNSGAGGSPSTTALDYCFTVSYVAPDTTSTPPGGGGGGGDSGKKGCPAAPSIAAHYLQSIGMQPTKAAGKNIVALVADHMTQGARFEGFDKCDAGYAPAVVAYVTARLP